MTPRRVRDRRPGSAHQHQGRHNHDQHQYHNHNSYLGSNHIVPLASIPSHVSDYESDTPYDLSDTHQVPSASIMPPPPTRSNDELNLSVLRRHNTEIASILSLTPYAVIYVFNPSTRQWEKSGVEGSMFVCQLVPGSLGEEKYGVFVLNRRGLENFDIRLTDGANVELTEEYVILKTDEEDREDGERQNGTSRIYGLWIYSEPPPNSTAETRSVNAQVIKECAVRAGQSLKLAHEQQEAGRHNGHPQPALSGVPMDRQISLKELFGEQRVQDDEWSVKVHSPTTDLKRESPWSPPPDVQADVQAMANHTQAERDILGDLFRRAGLAYQTGQSTS
jgi:hypothetical protein